MLAVCYSTKTKKATPFLPSFPPSTNTYTHTYIRIWANTHQNNQYTLFPSNWSTMTSNLFFFLLLAVVVQAQQQQQQQPPQQGQSGEACNWYCWIEERIARLESYMVSFVCGSKKACRKEDFGFWIWRSGKTWERKMGFFWKKKEIEERRREEEEEDRRTLITVIVCRRQCSSVDEWDELHKFDAI